MRGDHWRISLNFWHRFWVYGIFISQYPKAKLVIQPCNPSFSASCGWVYKFFPRHKVVLRAWPSINQELSTQLEGALVRFYADAATFIRIGKYPSSLVGNMDEIPAFLTWSHQNVLRGKVRERKTERESAVRSLGSEKIYLTVVLSATADV